jgi:hypothetical protein
MKYPLRIALAVSALAGCCLVPASLFAATGEVTLSGSTWTGKVDGVTKYTGSSMGAAVNACNAAMSSGTINIRNSGTLSTQIGLGSNRNVNGNGVSINNNLSGSSTALIRSNNTSNVGASNINMQGTSAWFGMYFSTCQTQNFTGVNGQGGGISYRIDNCKGGWGSNFNFGSPNTSGSGGHGIETMGINGSSWSTVTSNDHTGGCGLLIQSFTQSASNHGTTVFATRACYGCGYAGFRTANTNRNTTLTYDDATSCGRGYFSVSNSADCTITRVNANNCTSHGAWIQSAYNTHVSGGTITNCNPCSAISQSISGAANTITVTCR